MSELTEAIERIKENLRTPRRLITENRESVIVYKDELEAILKYVEELQEVVKVGPDVVSGLEVGDEVFSMIDYMEVRRGMVGKVVGVRKTAEYPIEVEFEGVQFLYLKNGVVGFKRDELGKVVR